MLTLSIRIVPVGSANLNKAVINEDFPAPVLPTIPILSLAAVWKEMFFSIILELSSYLNETSWNSTIPVEKLPEKCKYTHYTCMWYLE